jgi:hypothetical protein
MRIVRGVYLRKDAFLEGLGVVPAPWPLLRRYWANCAEYRQGRRGSTSQWGPPLAEKSGVLRVESSRSIVLLQRKSRSSSSRRNRIPIAHATTRQYATSSSSTSVSQTELSPASQTTHQRNLSLDPNAPHHDLPTFLAYTHRTGLSTSSTVYNGTLYEYLALETLRRYGFELYRVGGRGDRGVDLVGVWRIPKRGTSAETDEEDKERGKVNTIGTGTDEAVKDAHHEVLRVLVQCKRLVGKHAKIGPNLIRELDGAVRGARLGFLFDSIFPDPITTTSAPNATPSGITTSTGYSDNTAPHSDSENSTTTAATTPNSSGSNNPAIGVLVGTRPATKGVIESLRRSNRGLVWIMLEEDAVNGQLGGGQTKSGSEEAGVFDDAATTEIIDHQREERKERHLASDANAGSYEDMEINIETDLEHFHVESTTTASPSLPTLVPPKGRVKQIIWNQAARNLGLEDVDVIKRYTSSGGGQGVNGNKEEIAGAEKEEEVILSRAGRLILG